MVAFYSTLLHGQNKTLPTPEIQPKSSHDSFFMNLVRLILTKLGFTNNAAPLKDRDVDPITNISITNLAPENEVEFEAEMEENEYPELSNKYTDHIIDINFSPETTKYIKDEFQVVIRELAIKVGQFLDNKSHDDFINKIEDFDLRINLISTQDNELTYEINEELNYISLTLSNVNNEDGIDYEDNIELRDDLNGLCEELESLKSAK